jgi:hypothetical protein
MTTEPISSAELDESPQASEMVCYTKDGTEFPHSPDMSTLTLAHQDQGIFDLCCARCGRGGSLVLEIKPEDVNW